MHSLDQGFIWGGGPPCHILLAHPPQHCNHPSKTLLPPFKDISIEAIKADLYFSSDTIASLQRYSIKADPYFSSYHLLCRQNLYCCSGQFIYRPHWSCSQRVNPVPQVRL